MPDVTSPEALRVPPGRRRPARPSAGAVWLARDSSVRPPLEEVLTLRRDRMATVRTVIDDLTDESLASHTAPVEGAGWPPPTSFPLRECLLIVLNEEWHHRQFAERDLDALEAHARPQAT